MGHPIQSSEKVHSVLLRAFHSRGPLRLAGVPAARFSMSEYFILLTYLINALPGSTSVNMVHYETIEETVSSMSSAPSNSRNGLLCDQLLGYATVLTIEL
jgi:hypothetical protein